MAECTECPGAICVCPTASDLEHFRKERDSERARADRAEAENKRLQSRARVTEAAIRGVLKDRSIGPFNAQRLYHALSPPDPDCRWCNGKGWDESGWLKPCACVRVKMDALREEVLRG